LLLAPRLLLEMIVQNAPVKVFARVKVTVQNSYLIRMEESKNKYKTRREFVKTAGRMIIAAPLIAIPVALAKKTSVKGYVWQIDPFKCTTCGQCKTNCVLTPSASKAAHAYPMCGYCDLCGGYLRQGTKNINTGAESQLCPTGAIKRKFIEEPYFEYTIDEALCDGCAKCVKGCVDFGNGSLYMQIRHNLCVNCNECSIARTCPSKAVIRVPANEAYLLKDKR
jgi:electron transport complex protein RnfB